MMITAKNFTKAAQFILVVLLFVSAAKAAPGDLDPSFTAAGAYNSFNNMYDFAIQPDGKIIVGGTFVVANELARQGVARFNADGTLDPTFRAPDFFDSQYNVYGSTIYAVELQANGKVLVGGKFNVLGTSYINIIRLNTDGSLDTTFTNLSGQMAAMGSNFYVDDIEITASGAIIIGGEFSMFNQISSTQQIARLDGVTGAFDPTLRFVNTGTPHADVAVQPDGKILVSQTNMARFNTDGTQDNTFPTVVSGGIRKILVKPDGKIVIGGDFTTVNGFQQHRVSQLNSDGSFDTNFNSNNLGADGVVYDIALDANGKILIGGNFANYNGVPRNRLARLNADGSLDVSFTAPAPPNEVRAIIPLSNGQIFIGSYQTIHRINTNGTFDSSLNQPRLGTIGSVRDIIQQPDGKLIISGNFNTVNGIARSGMARLNIDGSVDTSFVPFFNAGFYYISTIAMQSTGKILAGIGATIYRLNPDGSRDLSFNQGVQMGYTSDIYVYPDDKILADGYFKLLPDGARDTTFNPPAINGTILAAAVQPDGKIVFGGDFTQIGGTTQRGNIARWNTDGSLDTTFNTVIGANAPVHDVELQPDGKIIVAGRFSFLNNNPTKQYIGRLNSDGTLDTSFSAVIGINTRPSYLPGVYTVKLQPDGKILIGGPISSVGGVPRNYYARLNSNGSLDTSLNAIPGADGVVWKIKLQADNKILLGGDFTKINDVSKISIARLLNPPTVARTSFDYDGDGKADISVFRASENKWYVLRSSDGAVTQQIFAVSGDVPVPADYDGDGKTDFAVFRPSTGDWWSLSSVNGSQVYAHWGASGDVPRPSDFDGDGRADYVVFRPTDNFWYRISSGNGATSNSAFGLAGDKSVVGDFDGDGKSDKAIFRPSTGDWWYQSSINNAQLAVRWGISTDIPAPADFDGDGKTDFAVYRASTGVWYIINSSNGSFTIMNFGISEDKPVPADYDGDGKADIAVFRPSTGVWYLQQSTAGFTAIQFGNSTDIPTQNAFVP
jgi:uncharacterized delta-60 repeat protein